MPLLYDNIPITHSGMVSAQKFTLPGDNRKVFFDIYPDGTLRKEIYILMNNTFNANAFANGSRLETPVRGLERIFSAPHEAYAIVVERAERAVPVTKVDVASIPVTFSHGTNAEIRLNCTFSASIYPENPSWLARDYVEGIVTNPEVTAAAAIKDTLSNALTKLIPATAAQVSPQAFVGKLDELRLELSAMAVKGTSRLLPWCRVSRCEVKLTVENQQELLAESNSMVIWTRQTQQALLDAILNTFGSSPLPAEISQVITHFIDGNPGVSHSDIQDFCRNIYQLCQVTTPTALLNMYQKVSQLPSGKGVT